MSRPTDAPAAAYSDPFVLVHISDLHWHRLPRAPGAYLTKRLLGALNLVLRRRRQFPPRRAQRLVAQLAAAEWQHLVITGDLTQLGTGPEFAAARAALTPLLARGAERVTLVPGNHDRYVAEAPGAGAFERHFGDLVPAGPVQTRQLTERWWLAAWDSAAPAPWLAAHGRVRPETLAATDAWLATLPAEARVIVANHYPVFFPPPHHYAAHHDLLNQEEVAAWLRSRPISLYLHGHIHHNWVHTVPGNHGPLTVVNSASSTQRPRPGDPSAFHRIELDGPEFRILPQRVDDGL